MFIFLCERPTHDKSALLFLPTKRIGLVQATKRTQKKERNNKMIILYFIISYNNIYILIIK